MDSDGVVYIADACNNRIVAGYWGDDRKGVSAVTEGAEKDVMGGPCVEDIPSELYAWDVFVGRPGVPGSDDGRGCEARLNAPQGLAIRDDGQLYAVDGADNTVRTIAPDGTVHTLPGPRDALVAPVGVAVSGAAACVVTDSTHVLWKVEADGRTRRLAGSANQSGDADGIGGAARFNYIPGVAVDPAGNIYVADHNNYTVRKMTPDGTVTTFAGRAGNQGCFDGAGPAARFMLPTALAADQAGNIAVADDNKIRLITPQGMVSTLRYAGVTFGRLDGVAFDPAGNLYAADREGHVIWKLSPKNQVTRLGSSGLAMGGSGWLVSGLAVNRAGIVYVADSVRNCIIRGRPLRNR